MSVILSRGTTAWWQEVEQCLEQLSSNRLRNTCGEIRQAGCFGNYPPALVFLAPKHLVRLNQSIPRV